LTTFSGMLSSRLSPFLRTSLAGVSQSQSFLYRSQRPCSSNRLLSSLVVAEHDHKTLTGGTLATLTAALSLKGESVDVLVLGKDVQSVAAQAQKVNGVKRVFVASNPHYEQFIADLLTPAIVQLQQKEKYTHVLTPASNFGKNLIPRVAALLDVSAISDIVQVIDASQFKRPIYAGNAIATVKSDDPIKVISVRGTSFEKAPVADGKAELVTLDAPSGLDEIASKVSWVSKEVSKSERPELTGAGIVVSGGRALKSAENFKIIYDLADKLKAAVGASRAAVDAGYCSNDLQVGQTGKIVAPQLYLAIGISGAIQHLAGMKDSKIIVAINKAEDAPIFQVADYGLVADLFTAVPELTSKLSSKTA